MNTPLMAASQNRHTRAVQKLLERGASVHATNDDCEMPLLAAAAAGHFDLVRVLIEAGASVDACVAGGNTVLTCAARWGHQSTSSMLIEQGILSFKNAEDSSMPLLRTTLESMRNYGTDMHEFELIWEDVLDRLDQIHQHRENAEAEEDDRSILRQFVTIMFRAVRFMGFCATKSIFARLVASQTVVNRFHDLHMEISFLNRKLGPDQREDVIDWDAKFEANQIQLIEMFQQSIEDDDQLLTDLEEEVDRTSAISFLEHEIQAHRQMQCKVTGIAEVCAGESTRAFG